MSRVRTTLKVIARIVSAVGMFAVAALHAVWASGSSWPAKNQKKLGEAVVGQSKVLPDPAATAVVAAGAAGAGLLATGALGRGRLARLGLRLVGTVMLLRAILGGDTALTVLGLPPAGKTFQRLDQSYYRPFAAVMGVSLWIASFWGRRKRSAD